MNSDSGRMPATGNRMVRIRLVMMGVLFQVCDKDNAAVAELRMSNVSIVSVVITQISRFRVGRVALYDGCYPSHVSD